jgi:hypothetical protein
MNEPQSTSPGDPAGKAGTAAQKGPAAKPGSPRPVASRLLSAAQLPAAILITVGVLAFLLWPAGQAREDAEQTVPEVEIVKLIGQHRLAITADTALEKKLEVTAVVQEETEAPKLKVTGAVVACLFLGEKKEQEKVAEGPLLPADKEKAAQQREAKEAAKGRWDFNTPELASAYADWLKAEADVPFYQKQLEDVRKLSEEIVTAKKGVKERLEKLVAAGTDPLKDLVAATADYNQAKVQSQKDEHEAQTNLNNAKRTKATLERQLFQAGIDPELLDQATENTAKAAKCMAIVAAEVPEGRTGLVKVGQACTLKFSAFPDAPPVKGQVRSLAPTISKERRTLRVFFQLDDPEVPLKPGMFAEISLGTGTRKILRISADGVLHVAQADYVLVQTGAPGIPARGDWKVTKILTGEQIGNRIEVLEGLQPGDRVIGYGAILLKPYVVQDVQATADAAAQGKTSEPVKGRGDAETRRRGDGETSLIAHPSSLIPAVGEGGRPSQSPPAGSAGR